MRGGALTGPAAAAPRVDRPYIRDDYGIPEHLDGVLPWSWAEQLLVEAQIYWVASVNPDGRPHVTPIWGVWLDDAFWMEGGPGTRRFRNLADRPATVVTVERGNDALILEGDAELVRDLGADLTERLLGAYRKYLPTAGYEASSENWREGSGASDRTRCWAGATSRPTRRAGPSTGGPMAEVRGRAPDFGPIGYKHGRSVAFGRQNPPLVGQKRPNRRRSKRGLPTLRPDSAAGRPDR